MGMLLLVACSRDNDVGTSYPSQPAKAISSNAWSPGNESLAVSYSLTDPDNQTRSARYVSYPSDDQTTVIMALEKINMMDINDAYEIVYVKPNE